MYDYKDKKNNLHMLNEYTLLKTLSMFMYTDLPETLNPIFMERELQSKGFIFITEVDGELYAFTGGLGGEPDVYGEPTKITISNPALNFNKTLSIKEDGVLIKNNDMSLGLFPIVDRFNTLLVENEITMFIATFNARIQTLISAGDDSTRISAEKYLEKVVAGELGVIGENRLFDGLNAQNTKDNSGSDISKIVEFNQYIKASLYNELGLNANFNMKRERLNTSEVEMNSDNLYPLIDNMFTSRLKGIAALNEKYNLEVGVEFGSIWKNKMSDGTSSIVDDESKILKTESLDPNNPSEKFEPELNHDEPEPNHEEPIKEHVEPDMNHEEIEGDDDGEVRTMEREPE